MNFSCKRILPALVLALLWMPAWMGVDSTRAAAAGTAGPAAGDVCPPFRIADREGRPFSLEESLRKGRTHVIFFWALRCAPCLREMAYLNEVYGKYNDKGLVVMGIEANGNTYRQIDEIMSRLKNIELEPEYTVIADPDMALSALFGIKEVPRTFLIGSDGVVIHRSDGFDGASKKEIEEALTMIYSPPAPEEPASPTFPPLIGETTKEQNEEAPTIRREETERAERAAALAEEFEKNRYFGDFYYHRREMDRALESYSRCLEIDPVNIYIHLKMAELFVEQKDLVRARELWEKVLNIDPDNSEAKANLRRLIRGDF